MSHQKIIDLFIKEKLAYKNRQFFIKNIYQKGLINSSNTLNKWYEAGITPNELKIIRKYSEGDYQYLRRPREQYETYKNMFMNYAIKDSNRFSDFSQVKAGFFIAMLRDPETQVQNFKDLADHQKYMRIANQHSENHGHHNCDEIKVLSNNNFKMFDNYAEYFSTFCHFGSDSSIIIKMIAQDTLYIYEKPIIIKNSVVNFTFNMMKNEEIVKYLSSHKKLKNVPDIIINHKIF